MNRREFIQSAVGSLFASTQAGFWSTDVRIEDSVHTEGQNCNSCRDFVDYVEMRLCTLVRDAPRVHFQLESLIDPGIHTWKGDCVYNHDEFPSKQEFLDEWDVDINVSGVTQIAVDVEITEVGPTVFPVTVTVND